MKWFDNEEFELTRREVAVDIWVFLDCLYKRISKGIAQIGKLKGDGREYELHVAAVTESCAEETGSESVFVLTSLCDRLGECRFSSPGESIDPENRNGGGDVVLKPVALNRCRASESETMEYGAKNVCSS